MPIRNLIASAILMATSTLVFAGDIAVSLDIEGAISSVVISDALAECADVTCKEGVLVEAIEAGIDAASVMSIALAANMNANSISSAMRTANVSESDIFAAAITNDRNPQNFTDSTATGNSNNNTRSRNQSRNSIPVAAVPNGISPTKVDQRAPVSDFDIPGISIGANNSIQFD